MELYIHIPFCVRKCRYCDFLSFPAEEHIQEAYVEALKKELAFYGEACRDREISTIYIGGGTPSCLPERKIASILEQVFSSFSVDAEAEISIECNPGTVTEHKLLAYRQNGINRLSIGLQSAGGEELKLLGRIHTYGQFLKTYEMARDCGFANINIDLMSSLPGQTAEAMASTLQKALRLKPEHISVYSLMIEEGTPFYEEYGPDSARQKAGMETEVLPDEEEAYKIAKEAQQRLKEAGYCQYEVSNFARPGYECCHNIGYWKREDYLGAGLGAASLIENIRYANIRELPTYLQETQKLSSGVRHSGDGGKGMGLPATNLHSSVEPVGRKEQMEETMFLGLRMTEGICRADFERTFGVPVEAVYGSLTERLRAEGLLAERGGRISLTERGQDLSNYVLAQFLLD